MGDKVMKPSKATRAPAGTAKQVKSGIIEGPTATGSNLTAFNRSKK